MRLTNSAKETEEIESLGNRVRHRLRNTTATEKITSDEDSDWVSYCFVNLLTSLSRQARRDARGYLALSLIVIGGGFATSGIAVAAGSGDKGTLTSWVVFTVGVIVALAGGASQLFRPGKRAADRTALAAHLRDEGWTLWTTQGQYDDDDPEKRFTAFAKQVRAARARADALVLLADSDQEWDYGEKSAPDNPVQT